MERPEMRVTAPSEEILKKMPRIVRGKINAGQHFPKPTGQQIDGEWEAIHLGKERYDKCGKCTERAPIARSLRLCETEREDDEYRGINDDERPEAVTVVHISDKRNDPVSYHDEFRPLRIAHRPQCDYRAVPHCAAVSGAASS